MQLKRRAHQREQGTALNAGSAQTGLAGPVNGCLSAASPERARRSNPTRAAAGATVLPLPGMSFVISTCNMACKWTDNGIEMHSQTAP